MIKAGDPKLCRIDVSILEFLAHEDIVPTGIPLVPTLPAVAVVPREETASSCQSLEKEIDKFHLEEKEDQGAQVIPISDTEDEPNKHSGVHALILVVARSNSSSEEEEGGMALNQRKGLKDLMVGRNKRSTSKEIPKS